MKKYGLLALLSVVLSVPVFCQSGGSTVYEDSLTSNVLHVVRKYTVYLPRGYDQAVDKVYPVLYLLHGHSHRNNCFVKDGNLQQIADELIAQGAASEMIIVTPDANRVRNGYFDTKDWLYETFFFEEFIPHIESSYRIAGDRASRAVAGFSMGGGGAVAYAIKHPDMFASVYAMSALITLPVPEKRPLTKLIDQKQLDFVQSVLANDCIFLLLNIDQDTLEEVRKIDWFVDCGDEDFLLDVNIAFYKAMRTADVPSEFRVRDGGHNFEYWKSSIGFALPFVSKGFQK